MRPSSSATATGTGSSENNAGINCFDSICGGISFPVIAIQIHAVATYSGQIVSGGHGLCNVRNLMTTLGGDTEDSESPPAKEGFGPKPVKTGTIQFYAFTL